MSEEFFIDVPNYRLAGIAWGNKNAKPVLALHGWLDNAASFSSVGPLLENCRVAAIDMPGHGLSDHQDWYGPYHLVDYVRVALDAADAVGWNEFCLLGHSLGANVATLVAAIAPKRISELILIEGVGPLTDEPDDAPDRLAKAVRHVGRLKNNSMPSYATTDNAIAARLKVNDMTKESATQIVMRNLKDINDGVTWRTDKKLTLTTPVYLTEPQALSFLKRIHAPTLLVLGEEGYLVGRDGLSERCSSISDLTTVTLPGKHHLHLDDAQPVADSILEFIHR
ncbi:MAG: alpha/beta hydrolase [Gammaproteobacteria bacterium]|nr:alpha/beta hydrolase [Gammaproteobacteria bacterium]